jgi:hypothetical protein
MERRRVHESLSKREMQHADIQILTDPRTAKVVQRVSAGLISRAPEGVCWPRRKPNGIQSIIHDAETKSEQFFLDVSVSKEHPEHQ